VCIIENGELLMKNNLVRINGKPFPYTPSALYGNLNVVYTRKESSVYGKGKIIIRVWERDVDIVIE